MEYFFTTGYLTQRSAQTGELTELVIPNREIQWIFIRQIREWFKWETEKNMEKLESFCRAFQENDTAAIEEGFNAYLKKAISIRDTNTRKSMKKNFYHGILLGLFGNMDGWDVQSNAESGDGYSDISIETEEHETGIKDAVRSFPNKEIACGWTVCEISDFTLPPQRSSYPQSAVLLPRLLFSD